MKATYEKSNARKTPAKSVHFLDLCFVPGKLRSTTLPFVNDQTSSHTRTPTDQFSVHVQGPTEMRQEKYRRSAQLSIDQLTSGGRKKTKTNSTSRLQTLHFQFPGKISIVNRV